MFVSEGADSLYQDLDPEALERVIRPLAANHDRLFLYGSIPGRPRGAVSPTGSRRGRWRSPGSGASLSTFLTAGCKRLARLPLRHRDLPEVADRGLTPVILHDPWHEADKACVDRFVRPAYPEAWYIPVRGAGHQVARVWPISTG